MRLNKNIKIFINYFLGPLLFLWLCYSIYRQVVSQSHLYHSWVHIRQSLNSPKIGYLIIAIVLMFFNWGLEAAKWKLSVRDIHSISFKQAFKAVLSGVSVSVTTPNRIGEYIGRMMFMPEGKRLQVIAVALIGSISQLLVTLLVGIAGFIVLRNALTNANILSPFVHRSFLIGLLVSTLILTLFYFNLSRIEKWLESALKRRSWLYFIHAVQQFGMQRLSLLLLLSVVRYSVFVIQYVLLFRLFEVGVEAVTLFSVISLVFLTLAIIPTIAVVVEFGIRGEVCLQLVGLFTANSLGIVLTSATIWFINLIIPALAGSLLILSIKIFKRREELRANNKMNDKE
jgi:uncharacterized membrane protein YbhN (UPF0104 family)